MNSKRVAEKKIEKIVLDIKKQYLEGGLWRISYGLPTDIIEYLHKWREIQDANKKGGIDL